MNTPIPTPLFVGNWKMNKLASEARMFLDQFLELYHPLKGGVSDTWIAPPLTAFSALHEVLGSKGAVLLGAQNVHWLPSGAHTGEVSPQMLKDIGATFVIVGHSERRQFYGETDEAVAKRAKAALENELRAIVCVGETRAEFEAERTAEVISSQLRGSLAGITSELTAGLIIAYEPVWAIGTGLSATPEIAQNVHFQIRGLLYELLGKETGASIPILYGGSTTADNVGDLVRQEDIDGALIGGASLKPESFYSLISTGRNATQG